MLLTVGTIYKPVQEKRTCDTFPNSATIDQAMKMGFELDHELVNKNIEKLLTDGNKAKAG